MSDSRTKPNKKTCDNHYPPLRFRILSLEGGGLKGAFAASVLASLEEDTNRACVDHFDLIAGTSTGGIIAIGLGMGIPARCIREFYRKHGPTIFPTTGFPKSAIGVLRHLFTHKHSQKVLQRALESVFCKQDGSHFTLGESRVRLVIPAYDGLNGRIYVFKTQHNPRFIYDVGTSAVDVALATAAAPTYFPAVKIPDHDVGYVDGGVWANCPALVAVTEATKFLNIGPDKIDILDIGVTKEPFNTMPRVRAGILRWNKELITLLMNAQAEASRATASLLTGGLYHKINYIAPRRTFSLDNPRRIPWLIGIGQSEARKHQNLEIVARNFLNGTHASPFRPCH